MSKAVSALKRLSSSDQKQDKPLVSIFVPLKDAFQSMDVIFENLVGNANKILVKGGHERVNLTAPDWSYWKKRSAQSLAIYYGYGVTTLIPIQMSLMPRVVVASSYHVKPLIAASSFDDEAFLLSFNKDGCGLTRVTMFDSFKCEHFVPEGYDLSQDWTEQLSKKRLQHFVNCIKGEVRQLATANTRLIFIEGASTKLRDSVDFGLGKKISLRYLESSSDEATSIKFVQKELSALVEDRIGRIVSDALKSSEQVQDENLSQLAQLVFEKKINKMVVSLDDMKFGVLNAQSGATVYHGRQKDCHDDDILDDLTELAIKNGIEVAVLPKQFMPKGRSYLTA